MKIAIIDSGGTNIKSIQIALDRLGVGSYLTSDMELIKKADKIILPGVGTAKNAMNTLNINNTSNLIKDLTQPVLGICLGMQILFTASTENDYTKTLDIITGDCIKIPNNQSFSVPHMGWNTLNINKKSPLFKNININEYFYFVHSYYIPVDSYTLASTDYSVEISAVVNYKNFYGCQFHPEKSGASGEKFLKNFMEL